MGRSLDRCDLQTFSQKERLITLSSDRALRGCASDGCVIYMYDPIGIEQRRVRIDKPTFSMEHGNLLVGNISRLNRFH